MEPAAQVERRLPPGQPGTRDHAPVPGGRPDRRVERRPVAGDLEDQFGAPGEGVLHAFHRLLRRDRLPGPELQRPAAAPGVWFDGDQPAERKPGEQRGQGQAEHSLTHDHHPLSDPGRPVEEQIHRRFEIGKQRRAFIRHVRRDREQVAHRRAEHVLVGHEGEHPGTHRRRRGGRTGSERFHPAHRGVAVGKGEPERAARVRAQGLVPGKRGIEISAPGGEFGARADRRYARSHARLAGRGLGRRPAAHGGAARALEPDGEPLRA